MIFPTLYKKKENGKLYIWMINVIYKSPSLSIIVCTHGEENGKKVIHHKDITESKLHKDVKEEAIFQASRKWKNKVEKELYLEFSNRNTLSNTPTETKTKTKTSNDDNQIAISRKKVRPMLAQTFKPDNYNKSRGYHLSFPLYVQPKYDGIRCIAYLNDNKDIVLESRKGIAFENMDHIRHEVKSVIHSDSNFYLDGEIYTDELPFETISGLVRTKENTNSELNMKLKFYIYDCIDLKNKNKTYEDRYTFLKKKFTYSYNHLILSPTFEASSLKEILHYHSIFVKDGYEGIILREKNGIYEINKRSKYLQKYKTFMEDEFKIIDFYEGTGDEKGLVNWKCITSSGKTFSVRPRGTFEDRRKRFLNGKKYIGKYITVIFKNYSEKGIPIGPVGKDIRDIY